jgi:hypothetical protein
LRTRCKITTTSSIYGAGAQNFLSTMTRVLAYESGSVWGTIKPDQASLRPASVLLRPVLIATSGWLANSMISTGATADITPIPLRRNNLLPTPLWTIRAPQHAG